MSQDYDNPQSLEDEIIGKCLRSISEATTEEQSLQLLKTAIDEGLFNDSSESGIESLLVLIDRTAKYPTVKDLAIKQMGILRAEIPEEMRYSSRVEQILLCHEIRDLVFEATRETITKEEALHALEVLIGKASCHETILEVAENLPRIVSESVHESVVNRAFQVLENLELEEEKRQFYREKMKAYKRMKEMTYHILCLEEKAALLKCAAMIGDFLFFYPEEMEARLVLLNNSIPEDYLRLRNILLNALEQLALRRMPRGIILRLPLNNSTGPATGWSTGAGNAN